MFIFFACLWVIQDPNKIELSFNVLKEQSKESSLLYNADKYDYFTESNVPLFLFRFSKIFIR